jgi:hypothetical protein
VVDRIAEISDEVLSELQSIRESQTVAGWMIPEDLEAIAQAEELLVSLAKERDILQARIAAALVEHTPFTQHEFPNANHKEHWSWQRCTPCGSAYPCATVAALSVSPEPKEGNNADS